MLKIKFNGSSTLYECKFRKYSENIVTLIGNVPQSTKGFKAYSGDVLLGDYSKFTTIYRVLDNGVMFSNDGSVEPSKEVTIYATFQNGEDDIPNSVNIVTTQGNAILTKSDDFKKVYTVKESEDVSLVSADDVASFTKLINDKFVNYVYNSPVPSNEQRIADLEEAVCELYERVGE